MGEIDILARIVNAATGVMTELIMVMGIVSKLVKLRSTWIMGLVMLILTRVTVMGKTSIASVLGLCWLV